MRRHIVLILITFLELPRSLLAAEPVVAEVAPSKPVSTPAAGESKGEGVKANPFDPSGFISNNAVNQAVEANTIRRRANYRMDGKRYQRFDAGQDTVYFPLVANKPEIREELAICPGHLEGFAEVLLIRDKLPIDAEIKKHEAAIVAIGHKCREARLASPANVSASPAKVEVTPPKEVKKTGKDGSLKSGRE